MAENNDFAVGYAMGQDSGSNNNGSGIWGGDGIWGILLFAMIFGWGRGGFGGGFGGGGCQPACATQADLAAGFNNSAVLGSLNDLKLGQAGVQQTMCQGFNGINTAVGNLGYNIQSGLNEVGHQISDCCCTTQRAIDGVNYNMAKGFCDLGNVINNQTRDIIDNANANYRGLMDFLVQEKLASKDAQIAALQGQLGRAEQNGVIRAAIDASTAEIIRRTGNECPIPAYVVPNPNCCYGNPVGVGHNNGGGCGFGC